MGYPGKHVVLIPLVLTAKDGLTTTTADAATLDVPFDCYVHKVQALRPILGGTTVFTDIDIDVENGTTDLTDLLASVDASAVVDGVEDDPDSATIATLTDGDILHLDVTCTGGGGSPTATGAGAIVWVSRR